MKYFEAACREPLLHGYSLYGVETWERIDAVLTTGREFDESNTIAPR